MRIVSLLPSATEILFALGLDDEVVGVTHTCDFPSEARRKPIVTRSRLDQSADSREIDARVAELREGGASADELDEALLAELRPDLIFTEDLCDVCAVPHGVVRAAVPRLPTKPHVYSLSPTTIGDVLSDVKTVGDATGRQASAREVIKSLRTRIDAVTLKTAGVETPPSVLCLEWLEPPWTAGHWVPEMVGMAGGYDPLAGAGRPSRRTTWEQVERAAPDVLVLMPCGFDLPRTLAELERTPLPAAAASLPALREGRAFAVDGSAYFNRPGPRLVDGIEILASIIHPALFGEPRPPHAVARI